MSHIVYVKGTHKRAFSLWFHFHLLEVMSSVNTFCASCVCASLSPSLWVCKPFGQSNFDRTNRLECPLIMQCAHTHTHANTWTSKRHWVKKLFYYSYLWQLYLCWIIHISIANALLRWWVILCKLYLHHQSLSLSVQLFVICFVCIALFVYFWFNCIVLSSNT